MNGAKYIVNVSTDTVDGSKDIFNGCGGIKGIFYGCGGTANKSSTAHIIPGIRYQGARYQVPGKLYPAVPRSENFRRRGRTKPNKRKWYEPSA